MGGELWAELFVIVVASVLVLPPVIAGLSRLYFFFRFRAKQRAWLLPTDQRATPEERKKSFDAYQKWQEESWDFEHRRYMLSIGVLKAWGFIIAANFVWNGFNGFFMALFEEYGTFPIVLSIIGFFAFLVMAVVWWVIELTYD